MISADVPYPDSVAALAEALRRDPVIVEQTRGSGDTAGAEERIARLVARLPYPAYVAVVDAPPDVDAGVESSRYLVTALSRRIGKPGLYVVSADSTPTGIRLVGSDWDQTTFSLQNHTNIEAVGSASGDPVLAPTLEAEIVVRTALTADPDAEFDELDEPSLSDAAIDELAQRERDLAPYSRPDVDWDTAPEPWGIGKRFMVGTTVGGILLVIFLQSAWGWPGWRRKTSPGPVAKPRKEPVLEPPDPVTARSQAGDAVTALAEQLAAAPAGPHSERASLAREAAEPLLDSDDVLDLVGAQALARAGRREAAIEAGQARNSFQACFFDPRHAEARTTAEWDYGDSEVDVPVCRACERAIDDDRAPAALVVRRLGRVRPYYEGDSVWARTGFGSLVGDLGEFAEQVVADRRGSR